MGYKIGKVYRITKNDDPTINYVGSTFTTLRQRWKNHKKDSGGCVIRKYLDKYGADNFKIILIREYEVFAETQKDNKHLRAYEQIWINKFRLKKSCINKHDALGLLNKVKRHLDYEKNKCKILEYQKNYRKNNTEKIKERCKNYKKNNPEKVKESRKKYNELNRDKRNVKIQCSICNSIISKHNLSKHQKTKKCLKM